MDYSHPMFELTRQEQALVAAVLFLFLLGLGVQHWRQRGSDGPIPDQPHTQH